MSDTILSPTPGTYAYVPYVPSRTSVFLLHLLHFLQLQNTLIIVIFNKSLSISAAARQSSTIGEIVNLMSVDANRVSHNWQTG